MYFSSHVILICEHRLHRFLMSSVFLPLRLLFCTVCSSFIRTLGLKVKKNSESLWSRVCSFDFCSVSVPFFLFGLPILCFQTVGDADSCPLRRRLLRVTVHDDRAEQSHVWPRARSGTALCDERTVPLKKVGNEGQRDTGGVARCAGGSSVTRDGHAGPCAHRFPCRQGRAARVLFRYAFCLTPPTCAFADVFAARRGAGVCDVSAVATGD